VLPNGVIGPAGGEPVRFTGEAAGLHYGQKGSLQAWKENIAAKAEKNALLTFALSLAFLGPLLRLLDVEGGGVHFRGPSSCGKTTLAVAAGSVWGGGGPLGFGQTWRATANALEMIAWGHNDSLLVFDELALVAPDAAGMAAYSLASGQAKGRSRTDGSLRQRAEWRVILLSTGEISLADHIRSGLRGERPMAGQELRLLDVSADAGRQMGIWEELHGAAGPAELSDAIRQACDRDYGHAGPAFVKRLVASKSGAIADAKMWLTQFLIDARELGDSGQAQRAAMRFGAIAAAGELAAEYGTVSWPKGWASEAASKLYRLWGAAFGRGSLREEGQVMRQIRAAIESRRSAFEPIGNQATTEGDEEQPAVCVPDREARSHVTLGFRKVHNSEILYCFHSAGWAEVTRGFDPGEVARIVDRLGFLVHDDGRRQKSVKIRGESHKLYCVKASLLEADLGD
jgi:putative DNA primase/helicase